jgi:hypothetical protein
VHGDLRGSPLLVRKSTGTLRLALSSTCTLSEHLLGTKQVYSGTQPGLSCHGMGLPASPFMTHGGAAWRSTDGTPCAAAPGVLLCHRYSNEYPVSMAGQHEPTSMLGAVWDARKAAVPW